MQSLQTYQCLVFLVEHFFQVGPHIKKGHDVDFKIDQRLLQTFFLNIKFL